MHRIAAQFVLRLMTDDQKDNRVQACQELLNCSEEDENILSRIITDDESWLLGHDIATKIQSSQWVGETFLSAKKAREVRFNVKVMLAVFFVPKCVAHHEYIPQGSTVNQTYYIEVLKGWRDTIYRKRPKMWMGGDCFFNRDNGPAL